MTDCRYAGAELELFAAVYNWKTYWSGRIRPFVAGDVLEVGAGIGTNTPFLDPGGNGRWVCLEPDAGLAAQLTANLKKAAGRNSHETVSGTLQSLDPNWKFDTIIYIDVLEHIEDDRKELENAASRLRTGGRIIVLSPAYQWLFSTFDTGIGHTIAQCFGGFLRRTCAWNFSSISTQQGCCFPAQTGCYCVSRCRQKCSSDSGINSRFPSREFWIDCCWAQPASPSSASGDDSRLVSATDGLRAGMQATKIIPNR